MSKSKVIPTIFSLSKEEFDLKLKKLLPISKKLQVDFMDGKFVKSKSVLPRFVPDLSSLSNVFEAHLMVENPVLFFDKIKDKGFRKIIFHFESFNDLALAKKFFSDLKKQKIIPVVAINPETKLNEDIVLSFDFFLLMGVSPGREGQSLLPSTFSKIRFIKKLNPKALIQVDGGVNVKNASKLFKEGVNFINSGSYISSSDDPMSALSSLIKEV